MAVAAAIASSSTTSLALSSAAQLRHHQGATVSAFGGLSLKASARPGKQCVRRARVVMSADGGESKRGQDLVTPTSLALVAAVVLPEVAEAAQPGVSASLKNLLLSVLAGGAVLAVIGVGVAGIASFDPVRRK